MRLNTPVTAAERLFETARPLISTTGLNGAITCCNDEFVGISGFARRELLGSPHDIVRHPDMPDEVFGHNGRHLKAGKAGVGVVEKRCRRNGGFSWVGACVTPIFENARAVGYEPARVKLEPVQALHAGAGESVTIAQAGQQEADAGVRQVIASLQALQGIGEAIEPIPGMGRRMAVASGPQSLVAKDISRQITPYSPGRPTSMPAWRRSPPGPERNWSRPRAPCMRWSSVSAAG